MKTSWLKNNGIYFYYAILLIVMLQWTNQTIAPPFTIRLAFTAAVFVPLWFVKQWMLPAVTICYYAIATYNYSYTYMPTELYIYLFVLFVGVFFNRERNKFYFGKQIGNTLVIFTFFVVVVNFLTSFNIENICFCLLILLLMRYFTGNNIEKGKNSFEICFMVITGVLSVQFLISRSQFAESFDPFLGLERSGWTDPNYFGMVLGMGTIVAFNQLFDKSNKISFLIKTGLVVLIVISLAAMGLNASRGAILSTGGAILLILFSSNIKVLYKAIAVLLFIGIVVFLYTNNYFDLLLYRFESDDGTGSGRITIWTTKLYAFFKEANLFNWLFGMGYDGGAYLGYTTPKGFHNDFLAIMIMYGLMGLLLFIMLLFLPFQNLKKDGVVIVRVYILYLVLCFLTLEPMTLGLLTFWGFYYFILLNASFYRIRFDK